jgi:3',5'-cyclic AMP phosphodiesterase CpdA
MTFRIAQISDTHLSAEKPFFVGNFERIDEALRAIRLDLVLNSGDISLSGESKESDLSAARALHEAIGLPVRFLPGNHDLGDSQDLAAHGAAVITDERRARYLAHFGADFWTLDVPGWRLLAINAQLLGSDLAAAADQEDAIVEATASLGARKLALFLHMPLFDKAADEPAMTGRFVDPAPRRALLARLRIAPPALIASGHVHQYRESWSDGAHHVWAPSTGYVIPDRRQPLYGLKQVGYVEHRLEPDGRHESRLVQVPGMPTLNIADFPEAYGPI